MLPGYLLVGLQKTSSSLCSNVSLPLLNTLATAIWDRGDPVTGPLVGNTGERPLLRNPLGSVTLGFVWCL